MPYLKGKRVLEVGCGRGGGIAMIHAHLGLAKATGLDLSATAIDNCRKWYQDRDGLTFLAGDACQLPFDDGSMDAIINVESAHGYPDIPLFLTHAARVLTDGGLFFFADFMTPVEIQKIEQVFIELNLKILDKYDITHGVLEGIRLDQQRKMDSLYSENIPKVAKDMLKEFMGSEGTLIYRRFFDRSLIYVRYVLERSGSNKPRESAPS